MIERWEPVPCYEDLYQVSDQGRIRRIAGGQGARVGHTLRPCNNHDGYPHVNLSRNGCGKTRTVHTLVAEAFLGPCPADLEVNHKNGIKEDNKVVNLEYTTKGENVKHSYRVLGRKPLRGEGHGRAKLTAVKVREIRRLYAGGGITQCELAKQYGMSQGTIGPILRWENWTHVA